MIGLIKDQIAVTPIFDPTYAGAEYADPSLGKPVDLWIPDEARERCDQGIIKYVGPDVKEAKIGMYVLFSGYTGTLIELENEGKLIIFREDFIVCEVLPPDTDVPGLYFRGPDGYFTATYEMAMELISRAFREAEWHKNFKATQYKEGEKV